MRSLNLERRYGGLIDAPMLFTSGRAFGEAVGTLEYQPLYHARLDSDEYRRLLDLQGFDVAAYVPVDPNCGRRTIWLAQQRCSQSAAQLPNNEPTPR